MTDSEETDSDETDSDETESDETDSDETDSDETDSDETDSDETDSDSEGAAHPHETVDPLAALRTAGEGLAGEGLASPACFVIYDNIRCHIWQSYMTICIVIHMTKYIVMYMTLCMVIHRSGPYRPALAGQDVSPRSQNDVYCHK